MKKLVHDNKIGPGIAWYSEEDWHRLKQIAVDADELDDTYEDWVANVESAIKQFKMQGLHATKTPVSLAYIELWCEKNNRPLDGAARAAYVTEQLHKRDELLASLPSQSNPIAPNHQTDLPLPQRFEQLMESGKGQSKEQFLKTIDDLFEQGRDTSTPPPYPYDKTTNTIRLPKKIVRELRRLLNKGQKPQAMKRVAKLTGAGLRVSKDYVDELAKNKK
ncbi:MAG: hypothetical protein AAF639_31680 [Chloroflexota bacterium]